MSLRARKKPGIVAKARKAKAAKRLRAYRKAAQQVVGEELICSRCGCWTELLQINHKRPRSLAPELRTDPANLEPVCPACHQAIHGSGRREAHD